jgi:hypothetical protein
VFLVGNAGKTKLLKELRRRWERNKEFWRRMELHATGYESLKAFVITEMKQSTTGKVFV